MALKPTKAPQVIAEGRSALGRRVTLHRECNGYFGARPFLTAAYWDKSGTHALRQLHSPFPRRAQAYYTAMLADEVEIGALMHPAPLCPVEQALAPGETPIEVTDG